MGNKTGIAWTDATWNPTTGCTRVSAGCDHCYAFQLHDQRHVAWKRGNMPNAPAQYHKPFSQVQRFPERLDLPRHWGKPRRVFVDSMADLFHEDVPFAIIARVFGTMHSARQHTYQILTKRPQRMREFIAWFQEEWLGGRAGFGAAWPREYQHVWLGVSVEDQQRAEERIPQLLATPAAVRFISAEPLLGPLNLAPWLTRVSARYPGDGSVEITEYETVDWVIAGGESGPGARPMHPEWARSLRDQCVAAGVAFFFKQWGEWTPQHPLVPPAPRGLVAAGTDAELVVYRVGKHRSGRELDGRTWEQFPLAAVPA